jgi:hypothetical protein
MGASIETEEDLWDMLCSGELEYAAYRELTDLMRDKADINSAEIGRLTSIPGLDPLLIEDLARMRDSLGGFAAIDDLQLVPGLDPALVKPFVRIASRAPWWRGQAWFQSQTGFQTDDTTCQTGRIAVEVRDHVALTGVVRALTPGQPVWSERAVAVYGLPGLRTVRAGNYRVWFGQKLVLGGDNRMTTAAITATGLLPDTGGVDLDAADENTALDGFLIEVGRKKAAGTFFYSGEKLFSWKTDGSAAGTVRDRLAGAHVEWGRHGTGLGITAMRFQIQDDRAVDRHAVIGAQAAFRQRAFTWNA